MKVKMIVEIQTYMKENDNGELSPSVLWDACKAALRGKLFAKSAQSRKYQLTYSQS